MAKQEIMAEGTQTETPQVAQAVTAEGQLPSQVRPSSRWGFLQKFKGSSGHVIVQPPTEQSSITIPQELNPRARADVNETLNNTEGQQLPKVFSRDQVSANARLPESKRIEAAGQLFGVELTPKQQAFLKEMHAVGEDRTGAGVYHYTKPELKEKIKIGREAIKEEIFTKEQYQALIRAGLAGFLPPVEVTIDPNAYPNNSPLRSVAEEIQDVSADGQADETFFKAITSEIRQLINTHAITYADARDLLRSIRGWERAAAEAPVALGNSTFGQTKVAYDWYESKEKRQALTPQEETDRDARKGELDVLVDEAIDNGVLAYTRAELKSLWAEIAYPPKTSSSYYQSRQSSVGDRIRSVRDIAKNYSETFWEIHRLPMNLRRRFEGVGSYIAAQIGLAMEKTLKGIPLSATEKGDQILAEIQRERAEERQQERERATGNDRLTYNEWARRFEFTWAENTEELEDSVFDWLEKFADAMPHENPDLVNNFIQEWRQNGINALEVAFNTLHIPTKSPEARRLKSTIEAYVNVLGGVRLLENRGGFEPYTVSLEIFSYNFNEHHDAIYLGNAKSAIIQDFLSQNDGEICLGGPGTLEKPLDGDTKDFRINLELQAKAYAAAHELYIKQSDFSEAQGTAEERARGENKRYGWEDKIEDLLLKDDRGRAKARNSQNPQQAGEKVDDRTRVFKRIKDRLDSEDMYIDNLGHEVSMLGLTGDSRKDVIRKRIRAEMDLRGNRILGRNIDAMTDQAAKDKALWGWVRYNNSLREKNGIEPWFPSKWDTVRLSIDRPTKLVDRALRRYVENGRVVDELKAMIEEVEDPYKDLTEDQVKFQITQEFEPGVFEARIRAEITQQMRQGFSLDDANREYVQRLREREKERDEKIDQVLFQREQRRTEAARAFNINRAYQKFLGVDARWGGLTTRVVADNGETKLRTIFSEARDILKAKIDKEEKEIDDQVTQFALTLANRNLTQEQIDRAIIKKRRLFRRNATFAATLGLREIGIANDLPIWNYFYYGDVSQIQAFTPLVGYTHNDKGVLPELLDRGRREMEAVFSYLADKYMDKNGGEALVVRDDPLVDQHEETWERARVVNEGGELSLRDLFEGRFMISTSGGVEVADLISKIADLGVYDLLWEHGCQDFREFQGFIKRRDEVELKKQSFWNTRKWGDAITYAQRLRGASGARKFLTGGEVKGEGYMPGVLNEPMDGAWLLRDKFFDPNTWNTPIIAAKVSGRDLKDANRKNVNKESPEGKEAFMAEMQKIVENPGNDQHLGIIAKDELIKAGGGILKYLINYMNSRRYLENRAGHAPKNWKYDNELMARAYLAELAKRSPSKAKQGDLIKDPKGNWDYAKGGEVLDTVGGEALGDDRVAYAIQGRSEMAIKIFMDILRGSSYHILNEQDRRTLDGKALRAKAALEAKRKEIVARGLPQEIRTKIDNRINVLRNQGLGQRIDSLNRRLQGLGMSQAAIDVLSVINEETKKRLIEQGVAQSIVDEEIESFVNMKKEIKRLQNEYYNDQLHREFAEEWPARLVQLFDPKGMRPLKV